MIDISSIVSDNNHYTLENNIVHFILSDDDRPWWSKQLELSFKHDNEELDMLCNYQLQKDIMTSHPIKKEFIDFISKKRGVKVDLASGPSGYFSAILDNLAKNDLFIITDACPTVIAAHSKANTQSNIYVFDIDLDETLPFKDSSVDLFSGNLLNNVNNYADLIYEVYRCLKPGGHFAVIDIFFDHGCKTYEHLNEKGEIWASLETFIAFCEKVGFTYLKGDAISAHKGRLSDGDLYPLDDNDGWADRTLYFVKK